MPSVSLTSLLSRYFEVIETLRRLMLTAIISVIAAGSSQQIVYSMMLAFFFLKLYQHYSPYADDKNGTLAEMGQYQIFFTFFGALIMSRNLLGDGMDSALGVFLILVNLSVMLLTFYFEYVEYVNEAAEKKEGKSENGLSELNDETDAGDVKMKEIVHTSYLTTSIGPAMTKNPMIEEDHDIESSGCELTSSVVFSPIVTCTAAPAATPATTAATAPSSVATAAAAPAAPEIESKSLPGEQAVETHVSRFMQGKREDVDSDDEF